MFADYRLLRGPQDKMPPIKEGMLYEYILAGNGVFLHAKRTGLEVTLQVAAPWSPNLKIRGLQKAEAIIQCDYPPVPFELSRPMLTWAESAKDRSGGQLEILFHLVWHEDKKKWELHIPLQEQSATSCKPVGAALAPGGSYERATIEVHSHHSMKAFFSSTDDKDEQGFRIYGVLGTIFERPTLRLRIGVYGQFWEVPAEDFFELGEDGKDRVILDAYFDDDKSTRWVEMEAEEIEGIPV
jgi:PRTRC genetic system protein A